jgi:hypothetical protein
MMKSLLEEDKVDEAMDADVNENHRDKGAYEYTGENQQHTMQALGEAEDSDVFQLDQPNEDQDDKRKI